MIRIEFDDGEPVTRSKGRNPITVAKGRARGFYLVTLDGQEHKIPISFMRISEAKKLEKVLNEAT